MIFQSYNYYRIFSLVTSLHRDYQNTESIDAIRIIKLYDLVRNSGCVCIKFFQWILPLIEINLNETPPWFKILEKIYDNCIVHEKEHTLRIFEKEHGYDLNERYELHNVIASGSIGQVYRVKEKYTGKILALKVLHPNVTRDIWYFKIFSKVLLWIPRYNQLIMRYLPVDMCGFIDEFEEQTDMINESRNMNMFLEAFNDSPIYKIPKPISYTKNTLLMTYEVSENFDDCECSEYVKSKIIRLMVIFIWNSHQHNMCHEDIHKGNWGVQLKDGKPSLVIYDYGLCARLLGENTIIYSLLESIFIDNGDTNADIDGDIIEKLIQLVNICLDTVDKHKIEVFIREKFKNKSLLLCDAKIYLKMLFDCAEKYDTCINTKILKYILVFSQMQKFVDTYYKVVQYPEQEINQSDSYRINIPDNYALCKTENICKYYRDHCLAKLDEKNESYDSMFSFTSADIKTNISVLKAIKNNTAREI